MAKGRPFLLSEFSLLPLVFNASRNPVLISLVVILQNHLDHSVMKTFILQVPLGNTSISFTILVVRSLGQLIFSTRAN